jgi:hypothetical protein
MMKMPQGKCHWDSKNSFRKCYWENDIWGYCIGQKVIWKYHWENVVVKMSVVNDIGENVMEKMTLGKCYCG